MVEVRHGNVTKVKHVGAIYHVTVQCNGRERLFRDDKDRVYLLGRLQESAGSA